MSDRVKRTSWWVNFSVMIESCWSVRSFSSPPPNVGDKWMFSLTPTLLCGCTPSRTNWIAPLVSPLWIGQGNQRFIQRTSPENLLCCGKPRVGKEAHSCCLVPRVVIWWPGMIINPRGGRRRSQRSYTLKVSNYTVILFWTLSLQISAAFKSWQKIWQRFYLFTVSETLVKLFVARDRHRNAVMSFGLIWSWANCACHLDLNTGISMQSPWLWTDLDWPSLHINFFSWCLQSSFIQLFYYRCGGNTTGFWSRRAYVMKLQAFVMATEIHVRPRYFCCNVTFTVVTTNYYRKLSF